ncbi:DNA repair protein RecN [Pseudochelatococcus contaminans]|uniref:DNA repair protein RecN n=1 Tax=Pseudochelatococcus contaminans TaxID=1538103 RepID=A0A7W5Z2N6_9HYPH|nr:DNA repair protein RecN [Pseudochelatococcus contaminans]MBB3808682.1 DNA repair protein RecN (Recombination protein N) [Pseudochelatococcus contaminans]
MLVHLSIRDIVLIDRLDLALGAGLTVLTGETGAGKSILLDAFALALGGRGDGSLVRHGEAQGQVTAAFEVAEAHPARRAAAEFLDDGEDQIILRRVQYADGRTRAFVNDRPVSAQTLRGIGVHLVEIHGQHDDRALTDPASHRAILDALGDLGPQVEAVAVAYHAYQRIRKELAAHTERVETARQEADFLRHAADELATLNIEAGEEEALATRRQIMMQSEKVSRELQESYDAVAGRASPVAVISAAVRRLERRADQAPNLIAPCVTALDEALNAIELAGSALEQALREAEFDPRELEQTEERLFAIRAAARKFNVMSDELPVLREKFEADLAALDAGEGRLAALSSELAAAEATYLAAARELSKARQAGGAQLDEAVNAELPPLKLERARFMTQVDTDETIRAPDGFDKVEFWVQTNPGTKPGAMMKVASGGELSRFMLALKVVLADRGSAPTLVFDEIDTGVGGAVADAIGHRMERLSAGVQVMAVTHAPQVAARAVRHLLIAKEMVPAGDEERVATRVAPLEHDERQEEIARMLAGATITAEARAAAIRLLKGA